MKWGGLFAAARFSRGPFADGGVLTRPGAGTSDGAFVGRTPWPARRTLFAAFAWVLPAAFVLLETAGSL